jgi:hypothetical protein
VSDMKHLNHISRELSEIRKPIFGIKSSKKSSESSERAWENLLEASEEISDLWTDVSVVEEIRMQREKSW